MGIYLFQNAMAPIPKLAHPTLATLKTDRMSLPALAAKAFTSKITMFQSMISFDLELVEELIQESS